MNPHAVARKAIYCGRCGKLVDKVTFRQARNMQLDTVRCADCTELEKYGHVAHVGKDPGAPVSLGRHDAERPDDV